MKNIKIKEIISRSWSVSWPMTLIMFFEFLIGLTDVFIAGRFGKEIQAAYGIAFRLYFVFIIIGMALNVGIVSVCSRLFTSGKKDEFNAAVNTSLITSAAAGLLLVFGGLIFSRPIVNLFHVPEVIKGAASILIMIYATGFLFEYVLMNSNAVLRASGLIRKSLKTMTIACTLNIILNFILAFKTPLGFKGLGVATVASLFIGMTINLVYVRRLVTKLWRFSFAALKRIVTISWPLGILHVLFQLGNMVIFYIISLLPKNNVEIMAAFTNGLKIESAIFLPAIAFNAANAVLVGNLLGKNKKKEAFRSGIVTSATGVGLVILLTASVMFTARFIAGALSDNAIVISECVRYIRITLLFEPILALGIILAGALNGAGDTKTVMFTVGGSIWLIRIPLCYIFGVHLGYGAVAVWWAMNTSIVIQTVWMARRFLSRRWMDC